MNVDYRGWQPGDVEAFTRICNSSFRTDGIEEVVTVDVMRSTYDNIDPEHCDMATDAGIAEVDGVAVGYWRMEWSQEPDGPRVYWCIGEVDGEHRRAGIGTELFRRASARADELRRTHPPGSKALEGWAWDSAEFRVALLRKFGLERVTTDVKMIRPHLDDIPEASMPEGLVVRTPTDAELRKVWEADREAFRDHFGYVEPTEADYREFLSFPYNEPTLWRVAWDGEEIAGQVRSFIDAPENEAFDRKRGWTEEISVRRPYRGRGLARSLLVQSLHALRERGMDDAGLAVHVDNPHGAFRLYESVGFVQIASFGTWRKTLE